jgi:hypothetical protein
MSVFQQILQPNEQKQLGEQHKTKAATTKEKENGEPLRGVCIEEFVGRA